MQISYFSKNKNKLTDLNFRSNNLETNYKLTLKDNIEIEMDYIYALYIYCSKEVTTLDVPKEYHPICEAYQEQVDKDIVINIAVVKAQVILKQQSTFDFKVCKKKFKFKDSKEECIIIKVKRKKAVQPRQKPLY